MWPLEVVVLHEEADPSLAVFVVGENGAREELLPHRLPEALDLPARLRVMWAALHVLDSVSPELFFEIRRAAPRRVLSALVREDFARRSVVRDRTGERLHDKRRALVVSHRQADQIARVIVEKRSDVHALMTT